MKKIKLLVLMWIFFSSSMFGQCDVNNFTVNTISGTCFSNGIITIQVPGAVTCSGWNAILKLPNGAELSDTISSSGGPVDFSGLPAGNYEVRLFNGITTINYPLNPISLSTSYSEMNFSVSVKNPICRNTMGNYFPNGELEVTIADGLGPYTYQATGSISGTQSFGPTTNLVHTFVGLEEGESIVFTVYDQCDIKTQTRIIGNSSYYNINGFGVDYRKKCDNSCDSLYARFSYRAHPSQLAVINSNSLNAQIKINNGIYTNLEYSSSSSTTRYCKSITVFPGDTCYLFLTDSCQVVYDTIIVKNYNPNYLEVFDTQIADTCDYDYEILLKGDNNSFNNYCDTTNYIIEYEIASGVWDTIMKKDNILVGYSKRIRDTVDNPGRYRLTLSDKCHSQTRVLTTNTSSLNSISVSEGASVLEGTSSIRFVANANYFYPLTFTITPTYPFTNPVSVNASGPLNLAGDYHINFPIIQTRNGDFSSANYILGVGDLPLGEYEYQIQDACGNIRIDTITISSPAIYDNFITTVILGCDNSNSISWSPNGGSNRAVWPTDGNGPELFVYDTVTKTLLNKVGGVFNAGNFKNSLPSGEYAVRINCVHFWRRASGSAYSIINYSATDGTYGCARSLILPISVPSYEDIQVSSNIVYCNDTSTIIDVKIDSGTPRYPLIYSLFDSSDLINPVLTDTAYTDTSLIATSKVFTNIAPGEYVLSVVSGYDSLLPNGCYTANINLSVEGSYSLPDIGVMDSTVCISNNNTQIGINALLSYWHVSWYDTLGNLIDTGVNVLNVNPTDTTLYIVKYGLLEGIGCFSPSNFEDTIQVDVLFPEALCMDTTLYLNNSGYVLANTSMIDNGSMFGTCPVDSIYMSKDSFTCADIGVNTVTLYIIDSSGYIDSCFASITIEDNVAPTMVCRDTTIYINSSGVAILSTTMIDNGSTDNCYLDSMWLSIDSFYCADIGSNFVFLFGSDTNGNTGACSANVTVLDTISPIANCMDTVVFLDALGSGTINTNMINNLSMDNCGVINISLSQTSFTCSDTGINQVTLYVADLSGNIDSCYALVYVYDTIPPMPVCNNITVYLDSVGSAQITTPMISGGIIDNCVVDTVYLDKYYFDCSDIGVNQVTLTAIDAAGNINSCIANVTVLDNQSPIIICPSDQYDTLINTCDYQVPNFSGLLEFSDNCSDSLNITITQTPVVGTEIALNDASNSSEIVLITATDSRGNSNTCFFNVNLFCVKELIIPAFISPNGDGLNDTWEIYNIEIFGKNNVKIFNRWGSLVYTKKNYKNEFNGLSNTTETTSLTMGNVLTSGTYYYILDIEDYGETQTGYLQIMR